MFENFGKFFEKIAGYKTPSFENFCKLFLKNAEKNLLFKFAFNFFLNGFCFKSALHFYDIKTSNYKLRSN